ncbi:MAG TPA: gliding motility-associated ABC transporter ATP-binding subunit GldA [Saprospirales bacterium]|nr:gliding motility-associated ABC transporter ATP-binding subunit GldA [Saprospirales bacterium]HAY71528.1 gliding motility-associated ABC transporter ATP-binding subunit GldA [Saprospirales bacterium]HRQ29483.1 gliding motility-associated ABC transporter ATP-binding subunit GldA [Saprospiraceae bacterium]
MSIKIESLTKRYGEQLVLDNISLQATKGEILGFLGPNGAGKSTTMKIITGYVKADSGSVEVCGLNALEEPIEIKQKIGYLPENNPLYDHMYVKEYLGFIASLHRLDHKKEIINDMIAKTGLTKEQNKKIKALSKGYRQRVGLAQAMLHDPEVLILDEPTSGLDPNQLGDIRSLIRKLGEEKTLIFSTHIMQEVEALCDRVVIIHEGQIVVDDHIQYLEKYKKAGFDRVLVEFEGPVDEKIFRQLSGFISCKKKGNYVYEIDGKSEITLRKELLGLAQNKQLPLIGLQKQEISVENVFQSLTK